MNISYLVAGLFAISLTASHVIAGERFFFRGIREYPTTIWGDGNTTLRLMKGAWHMLTWLMTASALTLFVMALTNYIDAPERFAIAGLIVVSWTGATLVYLRYAVPRPAMLLRSPIWINTVGTALFTYLGTR
jgi:hypothetical protein